MPTYRKRLTVEAEQFWPHKKPWPAGVLRDVDLDAYCLDIGLMVIPIRPGDWVVMNGETYSVDVRELCRAVDFPNRYESVPWPSDRGPR